ncbi:MAG TPA: molybdopterin-guanine dinucleotide biosynthesis protein MobB [bacterium]|nr:molybdopterin-guanine dinucleotide biosynthesis protein MobB [bacterium]
MQLTEALDLLLAHVSPLSVERVAVWNACGRVASEDVVAPSPVPHFRRAAMDGYVCHEADLRAASLEHPVRLRITGAAAMGGLPGAGPARGEAWTITTGGPMPARGDRVVPLEVVRPDRDFVQIDRPVAVRRNIAEPGEDIRAGTQLVTAGNVITAEAAAALAAAGVREVGVRRRLRAGIVATGTELVELRGDTGPLPPGRVFNSNSVALCGALETLGCVVEYRGIVPDEPAALRASFAALINEYDVVISTGGVSVGQHDAVHRTWLDLGARRIVGRVELKPGGPFFAARLDDQWAIGLSGTPVACLAAFHLLARPMLLQLQGRRHTVRPLRMAALVKPFLRATDRQRALWARLREPDGEDPEVELLHGEEPGTYASLLDANALALIAPDTPPLPAASRVPVLLLDRAENRNRLVVPRVAPPPALIGVIGASGSGKTTVLSGVLRRLTARGVKAVAVKHAAHGFAIDRQDSDSARFRDAGALITVIAGPDETALRIAAGMAEPDRLARLAAAAAQAAWGTAPDCILMEGFHHPDRPVIQVGPPKPGAAFAEVWASVPAVAELDAGRLEAEIARVADIVCDRLAVT